VNKLLIWNSFSDQYNKFSSEILKEKGAKYSKGYTVKKIRKIWINPTQVRIFFLRFNLAVFGGSSVLKFFGPQDLVSRKSARYKSCSKSCCGSAVQNSKILSKGITVPQIFSSRMLDPMHPHLPATTMKDAAIIVGNPGIL
jgi:hypothetical protein